MNSITLSVILFHLFSMRSALHNGSGTSAFYHWSFLSTYLGALSDAGVISPPELFRLLDLASDALDRSLSPPPWPVAGVSQ